MDTKWIDNCLRWNGVVWINIRCSYVRGLKMEKEWWMDHRWAMWGWWKFLMPGAEAEGFRIRQSSQITQKGQSTIFALSFKVTHSAGMSQSFLVFWKYYLLQRAYKRLSGKPFVFLCDPCRSRPSKGALGRLPILRMVHNSGILTGMVLAGIWAFPHETRQTIKSIGLWLEFLLETILQL